jgi:hypothetical protein
MKSTKLIMSALAVLSVCEAAVQAQTFTYNTGDLLASFRKSGSADDLIVDLGSASNFQNASGSMNFSGVSSSLSTVFGGNLDGIYWSVFGYINTTASPLGAKNTLFVTEARSSINIENGPNPSFTSSAQGQVVGEMTAIVDGAKSGAATILANQIIEIPSGLNVGGDPVSYTIGVGSLGDFNGTWSPTVENKTPTGFTGGSTSSASDLFQQNPVNNQDGTYLGDFVLANDGSLTFNGPAAVPEPSTWAMLGTGALGLVAFQRSRRAKFNK